MSGRPQVFHVPDFSGRYYSVQFTDPFNIDFAYVNSVLVVGRILVYSDSDLSKS